MASQLICLAGFSNSGKSTSLKYLDPKETFIISCTNKQLQIPSFRKKYKKVTIEDKKLVGNWLVSNSYVQIENTLKVISKTREDIKVIVVDDINYCLSNEVMQNALVKGYEKFSAQAKNYYDLIQACSDLRDDITVVLISHIVNAGTDLDPSYKLFTTGKLLDSTVNIDGLFSYIIYAERYIDEDTDEVKYRFKTRTDGNDTCRSVAGCFEDKYIEPNMKMVIDRINKFENE
jgi:adenosyl cobinamide kinase/adenosyl cobinamide phosphate guanylyltransferase